jgi:hypothetical protein
MSRAERKAAAEAKHEAALAEFHASHRCSVCGEAADVIVITRVPDISRETTRVRAATRCYCHEHAPR